MMVPGGQSSVSRNVSGTMDVGFISFAHDDNTPWEEGGKGWVDEFDYFLNTKLREHTGKKAIRIWRDPDLKSGDDWNETILEQVRKADVLVCVVSKLFVN